MPSEAGLFCGKTRAPPNSNYISLFIKEMEVLSQQVTSQKWGSSNVSSTTVSIYSLAQCHRDLSSDDCLQCYGTSRTRVPRCIPAVNGRIFLDGCFLRYDNYSFYEEAVDPVWDKANCNSSIDVNTNGIQSSTPEFRKNVADLIDNITASAVLNDGYAVGVWKGVYGLADCWKTVSRNGCRECLTAARREVIGCLP
ncbi:Cysteine-rich receptor-like protein kinase 42 [Abeliophyllum distichum]|uniref:Cysteine-rich receptor-like protein kinase 42 n=1 Tax=Abeliophyllum distichum TaxID=126358 RepID=A0ABD1Q499_9LAMI